MEIIDQDKIWLRVVFAGGGCGAEFHAKANPSSDGTEQHTVECEGLHWNATEKQTKKVIEHRDE